MFFINRVKLEALKIYKGSLMDSFLTILFASHGLINREKWRCEKENFSSKAMSFLKDININSATEWDS